MKKLFFSIAIAFSAFTAKAQPPIQWEKNYGGNNADVATSVRPTSDGGYITAGYTLSNNVDVVGYKSGEDYWAVKTNATGAITWKRIYGGSGDDRCYSVQQTSDGGYILAGTSNSTSGDISGNLGAFDMWVVKLNASGNIVWKRNAGGSDDDAAYSVVQSADGGYVVAGESKSGNIAGNANSGGYDYYIIKLRPNGVIAWQKLYGGDAAESAKGVDILNNGNICVAGETESNDDDVSGNKGGFDFWVLRLRANGTLIWANTYGGTSNDNAYSIDATADGGMIVTGESESNNGNLPGNKGGDDYWVLKLSLSGAVTWSKNYGGETFDGARSIRQTADGGYIAAGSSESSSADVTDNYGGSDYWLIKLSSTGNIEWNKNYGGADDDDAYSVFPTADGGYITAGTSESDDVDVSANYSNEDYWVVKLATNGPVTALQESAVSAKPTPAPLIKTFPNPVVSSLNLTGHQQFSKFKIVSSQGANVLSGIIQGSRIDVSKLSNGIYFITFYNELNKASETIKITKQ